MKPRNGLFWGIFLLTLGILFLARRNDWLDVNWHTLVDFWPALLILAGVNVILERRDNPAAFVTTVMLAVAVPVTLFGLFSPNRDRSEYSFRWNQDENDDDANSDEEESDSDDEDTDGDYQSERNKRRLEGDEVKTNTFAEPMQEDTREAVFKLAGGAGRFIISDPSSELIKVNTRNSIGNYSMSVERDPTTRIPTIELMPTKENQTIDLKDGNYENRVDVHLNTKPVWTMDVGLGAGQGELDLSAYAVKQLKVEGGAIDIDLKLGAKADQADVKLDVGAASVTIRVPKEVGCKIKKDGALNLNKLDDFTDVGGGEYLSPGYDAAKKKMLIRFDGGISSFKVVRY
ncbi:LiaI-LiaF-like domain-containing protein [Spirosoma pomorum]